MKRDSAAVVSVTPIQAGKDAECEFSFLHKTFLHVLFQYSLRKPNNYPKLTIM